ncbi:hypothetical protein [Ekhidna sp.]|uniref:hypothetical protein n=1 Tax=Ekhidna sp. TaxID=2608089 RepID=UPI003299CBB5
MQRGNLSFSLFIIVTLQFYNCTNAQEAHKQSTAPDTISQEFLFSVFKRLSTLEYDSVYSCCKDEVFIDSFNPLGPRAQLIHKSSFTHKDPDLCYLERGLWIKFNNVTFQYKNQRIWVLNEKCVSIAADVNETKKVLKKAVRILNRLETESPYAKNIIKTLQNSENKFVISLSNITESYTLVPLPDNRLGFLNNNAYAFQVIDKGQLLVNYAPFDKIGSGAEIRWTPALGIIKLAHELAHAYDANYGLLDDQLMPAYGEVMSAREIRALYHENIIRKEMEMKLKFKANTGGALVWKGVPYTYPLPVPARY